MIWEEKHFDNLNTNGIEKSGEHVNSAGFLIVANSMTSGCGLLESIRLYFGKRLPKSTGRQLQLNVIQNNKYSLRELLATKRHTRFSTHPLCTRELDCRVRRWLSEGPCGFLAKRFGTARCGGSESIMYLLRA